LVKKYLQNVFIVQAFQNYADFVIFSAFLYFPRKEKFSIQMLLSNFFECIKVDALQCDAGLLKSRPRTAFISLLNR